MAIKCETKFLGQVKFKNQIQNPKLNGLAHIFPIHKFRIVPSKASTVGLKERKKKRVLVYILYLNTCSLQQVLDECALYPTGVYTVPHQLLKLQLNGYLVLILLGVKEYV